MEPGPPGPTLTVRQRAKGTRTWPWRPFAVAGEKDRDRRPERTGTAAHGEGALRQRAVDAPRGRDPLRRSFEPGRGRGCGAGLRASDAACCLPSLLRDPACHVPALLERGVERLVAVDLSLTSLRAGLRRVRALACAHPVTRRVSYDDPERCGREGMTRDRPESTVHELGTAL